MVANWADANLENLFQLWQAMGADVRVRPDGSAMYQSHSWPHRCWVTGATSLAVHAAELPLNPAAIYPRIPDERPGHAMARVIDGLGMSEVFSQTAMVWRCGALPVKPPGARAAHLSLVRPTGADQVNTWVQVAAHAFGYEIDQRVFRRLAGHRSAQMVLACAGQQPVATALLFRTGTVMGLHQFGVLPQAQGKGYALQLLQALLQPAFLGDCQGVTLQASTAGFPLYLKQGFEPQFDIRNFRRTPGEQPAVGRT